MESLMVEERTGEGLTTALVRIAADPAQVASLHEILGTYCHQCRNILNSLKLSLYLAQRNAPASTRGHWTEVEAGYRHVEHFFDRLQRICRPMTLTPIHAPLGMLLDDRRATWVAALAARGQTLEFTSPAEPAIGRFDPVQLGNALDALIAWRAEAGIPGRAHRLAWRAESGRFQLDWDEVDTNLAPSAAEAGECPESLALPLLVRVISAHGGDLDVNREDGLHLRIRWPIDLRPS